MAKNKDFDFETNKKFCVFNNVMEEAYFNKISTCVDGESI